MDGLRFEWDATKAASNFRKHGVSFKEAETVFCSKVLIKPDEKHSEFEDRASALGISNQGRLLMVVATERSGVIRIISARKATRQESQDYAEIHGQS